MKARKQLTKEEELCLELIEAGLPPKQAAGTAIARIAKQERHARLMARQKRGGAERYDPSGLRIVPSQFEGSRRSH